MASPSHLSPLFFFPSSPPDISSSTNRKARQLRFSQSSFPLLCRAPAFLRRKSTDASRRMHGVRLPTHGKTGCIRAPPHTARSCLACTRDSASTYDTRTYSHTIHTEFSRVYIYIYTRGLTACDANTDFTLSLSLYLSPNSVFQPSNIVISLASCRSSP